MPSYVATIDVYFKADTLDAAERRADFFTDLIADSCETPDVSGLTTGVALEQPCLRTLEVS